MKADILLKHFGQVSSVPESIPRLRRFIIDLAVRGKLVEQNLTNEPAVHLLKAIASQKKKLVGAGEIKTTKPPLPINEDEIPFNVPASWVWTRLNEVTSYIQRGKSPKYATSEGLPVISQKCVQWRGLNLELARFITFESIKSYESQRFLRNGDLLWNSTGTGTIGRTVRISDPPAQLVCDSHVTVVRCCMVDSEYIQLWLRSDHVYGSIEGRATGSTNQVELTSLVANNLVVPLPPLVEQHRIVAKVKELMVLCDRLEDAQRERETHRDRLTAASLYRLNNISDTDKFQESTHFFINHLPKLTARPEQIKQLRQSILDLAVRGKLVHHDAADEPASQLLSQVAAERATASGSGRKTRVQSLAPINLLQVPFEIPSAWTWARFPDLGIFGRGKSKHRPRNDRSLFVGGAHPLVQTGDVARSKGKITTFTGLYNDAGLAQSLKWPAGTLCITIAANIADSGILAFDACFPDSVVGFIPSSVFLDAKYFEYFLRTAKADLLKFAPATAQKNINLEILTSVLIPLPPLPEQRRIVQRIDELMVICDELESKLITLSIRSTELLECVLHQALNDRPMVHTGAARNSDHPKLYSTGTVA